ncbi:MAG TPA: DUF120 domain-containing protein [Pirellulales bacterium]|nr:DUF120 domain-containing protein [Pirellulales bacterium]
MKTLDGIVEKGSGVASPNLHHVKHLIEERTGLSDLVDGTLNVRIEGCYFVTANATISKEEYDKIEGIKLQRCRIGGLRALVMRPETHEQGTAPGATRLELMCTVRLRDHLHLEDGDKVSVELEGDDAWWNGAVQPALPPDAWQSL